MSKKVISVVTLALILSLFALGTQTHSIYADGAATAPATERPEGTREANTSPFCAGINANAATPEANGPQQQPRAAMIAAAYGVTYEEVIGWFCKGYGFGQIDRAYAIAKLSAQGKTPMTAAQVLAQVDAGTGWGEIVSAAGLTMKDVNQARRAAFGHGRGNGNGHGKGKGNGNSNGIGNGDGKANGNSTGNSGGDDNGNEDASD